MMSAKELCDFVEQKTTQLKEEINNGKKTWGRWTYNASEPASIDLDGYYEVELHRIDTDAKLGTWLLHLNEKRWVTTEDLGFLVQAIQDLNRVGYHKMERTQSGC
jgi:hypothetical protein